MPKVLEVILAGDDISSLCFTHQRRKLHDALGAEAVTTLDLRSVPRKELNTRLIKASGQTWDFVLLRGAARLSEVATLFKCRIILDVVADYLPPSPGEWLPLHQKVVAAVCYSPKAAEICRSAGMRKTMTVAGPGVPSLGLDAPQSPLTVGLLGSRASITELSGRLMSHSAVVEAGLDLVTDVSVPRARNVRSAVEVIEEAALVVFVDRSPEVGAPNLALSLAISEGRRVCASPPACMSMFPGNARAELIEATKYNMPSYLEAILRYVNAPRDLPSYTQLPDPDDVPNLLLRKVLRVS